MPIIDFHVHVTRAEEYAPWFMDWLRPDLGQDPAAYLHRILGRPEDLLAYLDGQGIVRRLDERTRIPAMYDGVVVRTCDDFLGRSIVMEHPLPAGGVIYSMYGHTVPRSGLQVGQVVRAGDVVAHLADATRSRTGVLPHLHVSLGWAPRALAPDRFAWETIAETLTLLDPLQALDGPTRLVEPASVCRELVRAFKEGATLVPGPAEGGVP